VLILSSYTGQDDVVQALQAGAAGYLPKLAGENELSLAIQTIIGGQTYNLTTDAVDPISKEPEFKACAVNMVPIKMPELDSDPVPVNGTKSRLLPLAAD
jgi:DNA-binding NarL/FixJ family response regulator